MEGKKHWVLVHSSFLLKEVLLIVLVLCMWQCVPVTSDSSEETVVLVLQDGRTSESVKCRHFLQ
jgi:hypothetical protein